MATDINSENYAKVSQSMKEVSKILQLLNNQTVNWGKQIEGASNSASAMQQRLQQNLYIIKESASAYADEIKSANQLNQQKAEAFKLEKERLIQQKQAIREELSNAALPLEKKKALQAELNSITAAQLTLNQQQSRVVADQASLAEKALAAKRTQKAIEDKTLTATERLERFNRDHIAYQEKRLALEEAYKNGLYDELEYKAKSKALEDDLGSAKGAPSVKDEAKSIGLSLADKMASGGGESNAVSKAITSFSKGGLSKLDKVNAVLSVVNGTLKSINNVLGSRVTECLTDIATYSAKLNTRLYGSSTGTTSFADVLDDIKSVGTSRFVDQKKLLSTITELNDAGILYNIETRAVLQSIKDQLVTTFDALDANLTRLTRLQQADMTQQDLGTESLLTMYLNSMFKDSSYMTDMYHSVYGGIVDAMSTLDTDQATRFNFNLQKWLAALYSVGMSSSAISNIVSAFNSLATGDINSLSGSSQELLVAMTTNKAGKSYADYLSQGLTGDDVDTLMQSMVEYLKDIADNTDSKVLRSQWSNLLGLTNSDWKAITNITTTDIASIANYDKTQQDVLDEVSNLLNTMVDQRTHISQQMDTAWNNTLYSYSMGLVEDTGSYIAYRASQLTSGLNESVGSGKGILSTILNFTDTIASIVNVFNGLSSALTNITEVFNGSVYSFMDDENKFSWTMQRGTIETALKDSEVDEETSGLSESASVTVNKTTATNEDNSKSEVGGTTTDNSSNVGDTTNSSTTTATTYIDQETVETVGTSAKDKQASTFAQQESATSATYKNITNEQTVKVRDINDIYAMLFEDQTTPIRVKLAQVEDEALGQLEGRIYNVNLSGDTYSSLSSIRSL